MNSFIKYFNGGFVSKDKDVFNFRIEKFTLIYNKIIPFFSDNKIYGIKFENYLDLCKAAELMINKAHLNEKGLEEIRKIKSGMNKGRL
jgi:hypothetical protein